MAAAAAELRRRPQQQAAPQQDSPQSWSVAPHPGSAQPGARESARPQPAPAPSTTAQSARPQPAPAQSAPAQRSPGPSGPLRPGPAQQRQPAAPQQRPAAPQRPRQGAATTGQFAVARTRATTAGPTGTAPLPVIRPTAPAPQGDEARRRLRSEPPAAAAAAPVTSGLRTVLPRREALGADVPDPRLDLLDPDTSPQRTERADPRTAPSALQPAPRVKPAGPSGPAPRMEPARATRPAPVVRPVPPPPTIADPVPTAPRRRRPFRTAFAVLAALGLVALHALPSIAAAEVPPVAGIHPGDNLQVFEVGGTVDTSGARMDGMTGEMPVIAPTWVVPLRGDLRDGFGLRLQQPVAGVSLFHRGQDIGGGCGAPIHAAAAGTVVSAGWWGTYGNWVLIDHGNGIETGYAHQSSYLVQVGQRVKADQVIGYEGSTGASTGCHLHLEVHINGIAVNPVPFFIAKGIPLGP